MDTRHNGRAVTRAYLAGAVLLASALASFAQSPAAAPVGLPAIAAFDRLPLIEDDAQFLYASSYDRTGGNDDGFKGTYSALAVDARGEHVIFDARGPGCVYTLWFTSRVDGWSGLDWGRLRLYFDDEENPRLDIGADELFAGTRQPFVAPFVYGPFTSTGGHVLQLPLPFARRLRITTERRAGFYNVAYKLFAADRPGHLVDGPRGCLGRGQHLDATRHAPSYLSVDRSPRWRGPTRRTAHA